MHYRLLLLHSLLAVHSPFSSIVIQKFVAFSSACILPMWTWSALLSIHPKHPFCPIIWLQLLGFTSKLQNFSPL
ncbi:hypothetical protein PHET_12475, partial [Paragonimus heterotremus]